MFEGSFEFNEIDWKNCSKAVTKVFVPENLALIEDDNH